MRILMLLMSGLLSIYIVLQLYESFGVLAPIANNNTHVQCILYI